MGIVHFNPGTAIHCITIGSKGSASSAIRLSNLVILRSMKAAFPSIAQQEPMVLRKLAFERRPVRESYRVALLWIGRLASWHRARPQSALLSSYRPAASSTSVATDASLYWRPPGSFGFDSRCVTAPGLISHACGLDLATSGFDWGRRKLPFSNPCCMKSAVRSPSLKSVLPAGIAFRCCRLANSNLNLL